MKILTEEYDYQLDHRHHIAVFKKSLIDKIWDRIGHLKTTENYQSINRGISDTVDEFIKVLYAEYTMLDDVIKNIGNRDLLPYAINPLLISIADEIRNSDNFYVVNRSDMFGRNRFSITIPFIKTRNPKLWE